MAAGSLTALHHSQSEVRLLLLLLLRTYQVCCKWYTAQFPECNWPLHATEGDTNIKPEREKQASDNLGFFFTMPFYGCSQVSDTFDKSCTSTVVLV